MPPPSLPPTRPAGRAGFDVAPVPVRDAVLGWAAAWLVGQLVAGAVAGASGADDLAHAGPGWLLAASVAQWVPMLVVVWSLGRRFGAGHPVADFALRFRLVDLLGLPVGVLTQLVLLRLVYWPLESIWPATFTRDDIEQRARDLYDSAHGGGVALLVIAVVAGAPLVEELVYRGLLQGAFTRRLRDGLGLVVAASWFALIHFQPVEYPGLFVAGLVFGACAVSTRRLGMGVAAHLAFNATGLALVAAR